ncbi:hypothetical protein ACHAWF_016240 [Thalassiosira exigua]
MTPGTATHGGHPIDPKTPRSQRDGPVEDSRGAAMPQDCKESVASAPPTQERLQPVGDGDSQTRACPADVGDLVKKAKKAAASLWMILHAQNCRLPAGTCPHRGCAECRLLLVHVKTCPAGPGFPCPTKGCRETRTLLAHYRRCKDLRAKQVGLGRRAGSTDRSCLVCSLVARYARSAADKTCRGVRNGDASSVLSSSRDGKFSVERGLPHFADPLRRTPSMTLMPPPPPRARPVHQILGSSPSPSQLLYSNAATVAAATDLLALRTERDSSSLSKSLDGTGTVPFPILRCANSEGIREEELVVPCPVASKVGRQRAESYDERKSRVKFSPTVSSKYYFDDAEDEQHDSLPLRVTSRPRSASCSNMVCNSSDPTLSPGCDTIAEESMEHEGQVFPMD